MAVWLKCIIDIKCICESSMVHTSIKSDWCRSRYSQDTIFLRSDFPWGQSSALNNP
jgi:hypothetical protein